MMKLANLSQSPQNSITSVSSETAKHKDILWTPMNVNAVELLQKRSSDKGGSLGITNNFLSKRWALKFNYCISINKLKPNLVEE